MVFLLNGQVTLRFEIISSLNITGMVLGLGGRIILRLLTTEYTPTVKLGLAWIAIQTVLSNPI